MDELFGQGLIIEGLDEVFVGAGVEGAANEVFSGFAGDHHDFELHESLGAHFQASGDRVAGDAITLERRGMLRTGGLSGGLNWVLHGWVSGFRLKLHEMPERLGFLMRRRNGN